MSVSEDWYFRQHYRLVGLILTDRVNVIALDCHSE
jgi:hypothetical protein